ncbi:peptidyl-prolyl cis-trans isomerase [Proteiniclasticum sp.]|uniref:peptidyl-prolyl cis-trans isomerase n=1 Tax=Proteiniclasticum sp. TaxID=2053595 RepID=UPI00289EF535|nr:peptidyl-prolyl cis-trans isomerase [Proteiniclasticum sp.]
MISLKKKVLTVLSASVLAVALAGCGLVEETQESIDGTVLAKVGDVEITQKDVEKEAKPYLDEMKVNYGEEMLEQKEGKEVVAQLKKDILNGLVEMRIIDRKVEETGMDKDTEEIAKAVEDRIAQVRGAYEDEETYKKALTDAGYDEESYRAFVKSDIVRNTYYETIMEDVAVTDEDVKAYYEENKASFMTPAGANIYHIYFGTDDAAKAEGEKALKLIKEEGKDFAEVAEEYGNDLSADKGGLLGYYAYDNQELYADFMEHVKKLKENEISDVVKSTAGYHIIKVDQVTPEPVQKTLEEVKESVSATVLNTKKSEKYASTMEEWKKELNVKVYEDKIR